MKVLSNGSSRWLEATNGRPEWGLWGKAQPLENADNLAHPLICHMMDVALVARRLLEERLARSVAKRLADSFGLDESDAFSWLTFLVAMHDLGKASPAFQLKAESMQPALRSLGFDLDAPRHARHHGEVGVLWIVDALLSMGLEPKASLRLARAVAAHHGEFPPDAVALDRPGRREAGKASVWQEARRGIVKHVADALGICGRRRPALEVAQDHSVTILIAGLTSVADWLGSMQEVFRYELPFESLSSYVTIAESRAEEALEEAAMGQPYPGSTRTFTQLFGFDRPWPLHETAERIASSLDRPSLIVVEAPMGEGKTEAALLIAAQAAARLGHSGLFVGLPTQATANQMFGRVERFLQKERPGVSANLHLAHGGASLVTPYQRLLRAVYDPDDDGGVRAERWFADRKRALLASHAVGTVDQALLGVLRTRHGFVRLFGLAGKTVVLDEVHAYDTYTSTLLERLICWLSSLGTTVVLLSATLPSEHRRRLQHAYGGMEPSVAGGTQPYPRVSVVRDGVVSEHGFGSLRPAVEIELERCEDDLEAVATRLVDTVARGGCAGWLCNTVARAQQAFRKVDELVRSGRLPEDTHRLLLHARLLSGDRTRREEALESMLGRTGKRPLRAIVVGTQVLEQSLDVDFDVLATDVAPIDLLLQRAGRLHRHQRVRPPHVARARLILISPLGDPLVVGVKAVAGVYDEYILRRTLLELHGRDRWVLPEDIEPSVERVYSEANPNDHADALSDLRESLHRRQKEDDLKAQGKLLPRPTVRDDPFGQFPISLRDDEDPARAEELRAVTRLGPPSIEVVCLDVRQGGVFLGSGRNEAVDLETPPTRSQIRRLLECSTRVSTRGLVQWLLESELPAAWRRSPLLRYRRPILFEDGETVVGAFRLVLDETLGLVIDRRGGADD